RYKEYLSTIAMEAGKIIDKLNRHKKLHFEMNSGFLKFSTIHSFKGMQSPYIVAILRGKMSPEMVYSAISRAKFGLLILAYSNNKYRDFFMKYAEESAPLR
ncbi:MAG: hypothetical protein K2H64_07165, partial [Desulfovibrio sp.]|nr:hypothetical protein [Desulfovibrio sp.]